MFRSANNIVITGGQLMSIENNVDPVSTTLWQHVAAGAMFDSAERYPPGRCHPGTRQRIIKRITDWIINPPQTQRVLWLYGSAGSGKSAVMQSICELLKDSYPEMYGGSFFFARGHADRGKGIKLFVTISYQLAIHYPSLRADINDVLRYDPSLPTKSMDIQLLSLIINPLLRCKEFQSHMPIIIIDGLDECDAYEGMDTQRKIVALISESIIEYDIPIRFMIASRNEYWIRDALEASPLSRFTLPLSLRDDIDADRDIRSYLMDEFEKIRLEKGRIMRLVVPPWPPANIISHIVEQASGQYIYASTILKFVGKFSPFCDPQKQLHIITTPGPHQASAFSELDRLYATILSAYPRREKMKIVLGGLLAGANLTIIETILCVGSTEIALVLDALSSLIDVFPPKDILPSEHELLLQPIFGSLWVYEDEISFCHLSFREFLRDETRSGPYYVDSCVVKRQISSSIFNIIHRNLDQNYKTEPHVSFNIDLTTYRRLMSGIIFQAARYRDIATLLPLLTTMTTRLQLFHSNGTRVSHPACFMQDMEWIESMLTEMEDQYESGLSQWISEDRGGEGEPDGFVTHSFQNAICELRETASLARKQAIRSLSLCDGFRITPTLFYIALLGTGHGIPVEKLFTIPGNSIPDTLSSLRQHRHIIKLYKVKDQGWFTYLVDLYNLELGGPDNGWLSRSEWMNQRVGLVYECLKSLLNNLDDNDWEHSFHEFFDMKHFILGQFFDGSAWSDIHGRGYFENQYNLSLLGLMVDTTAWIRLLPSQPRPWMNLFCVIGPVLGWFNRQLTNEQTLGHIEHYDASLRGRMTAAMNSIFQHCFVSVFTTPYFTELLISTSREAEEYRSINIRARPWFCWAEETAYSPPEDHEASVDSFRRVHDELFAMVSINHAVLERWRWYPHLACYLLNVLVKYLYCQAIPEFRGHGHDRIVESKVLFSYYTIQCLSYALTTQQNLDALRAIKYFSSLLASPWHPPSGFCSLTVEFLKKYEHSVLSSEELHNFEHWLSSVKYLELSECMD